MRGWTLDTTLGPYLDFLFAAGDLNMALADEKHFFFHTANFSCTTGAVLHWVNRMRAAFVILVALTATSACSSSERTAVDLRDHAQGEDLDGNERVAKAGLFFETRADASQQIDIGRAARVTIQCFCPNREVEQVAGPSIVILNLTGKLSISGFHGSREAAGARPLSPAALTFAVSWKGSEFMLSSPEWTYIHHSFTIQKISVLAPRGVEIVFDDLTRASLEDRRAR